MSRFPVNSQHAFCGKLRTRDKSCSLENAISRTILLAPPWNSTGFQPVNTQTRCFGATFWCHLELVRGALLCISVRLSTKRRCHSTGPIRASFEEFRIYFVRFMAEREGFEPPIALRLCLISSQVHSLQEPHLQILAGTYCSGATWSATRNLIDSVKPGRPGRWGQRLTAAKMKECI
jgi:hypothetical protein